MAFDVFLKIDDIPGESTDDKHKDWIEILSYSQGENQPSAGSRSSGGAASSERVNLQDLCVAKTLDKASPKLALYCCNGKHIPTITLELCRATGDKQVYMVYKLTDSIVSSVQTHGSASSADPLPLEDVTFNFGQIDWTYTATDHGTGKPAGNVASNWSVKTNKGA